MEQTIAFINESFAKQGDVTAGSIKRSGQSAQLEKACSLIATSTLTTPALLWSNALHDTTSVKSVETLRTVLALDRSDPLSVSIESSSDGTIHQVLIKRAVVDGFRALDVAADAVAESLPEEYYINAIVRSVSGSSLMLVTGEGHLVQATLDSNAKFSISVSNGKSGPGTAGDIAVGDHVGIYRQTWTEGKGKKAQTIRDQSVVINKNTAVKRAFSSGIFADKDLADRVAKAFVHAIVLCHKDDKPSPF
jgi:hypothetical protein